MPRNGAALPPPRGRTRIVARSILSRAGNAPVVSAPWVWTSPA